MKSPWASGRDGDASISPLAASARRWRPGRPRASWGSSSATASRVKSDRRRRPALQHGALAGAEQLEAGGEQGLDGRRQLQLALAPGLLAEEAASCSRNSRRRRPRAAARVPRGAFPPARSTTRRRRPRAAGLDGPISDKATEQAMVEQRRRVLPVDPSARCPRDPLPRRASSPTSQWPLSPP